MIQNESGNAVPDGAHARGGSNESYSYSYSESEGHPEDDERAHPHGAHAAEGGESPSQHHQFSPRSASGDDTNMGAGERGNKNKANGVAGKPSGRRAMDLENDADNIERRGKKRRNITLPGSAKVQAMVKRAATTASADTQRITIYISFALSFINVLFVILCCVLSQLDTSGGGCYTYWGFKVDCDSTSYTIRSALLWNKQMKQNLQAASAMSIFAVLSAVGTFIALWMLVIRVRVSLANDAKQRRRAAQLGDVAHAEENGFADGNDGRAGKKTASYIDTGSLKWATIGLMAADILFSLIAWAIIAGLFAARPGEDKSLPRGTTYGVGFGLGITAWIAKLITLFFFTILV